MVTYDNQPKQSDTQRIHTQRIRVWLRCYTQTCCCFGAYLSIRILRLRLYFYDPFDCIGLTAVWVSTARFSFHLLWPYMPLSVCVRVFLSLRNAEVQKQPTHTDTCAYFFKSEWIPSVLYEVRAEYTLSYLIIEHIKNHVS